MESGLLRGQLVKWKDDRGFGFIQPIDGSREIFLHISALKDATRRPQVGDTIYYHKITEDGKIRACNAFILGARRKPLSSASTQKNTFNTLAKRQFPLVETVLLSIVPLIGIIHFTWKTTNLLPLILYPVMSVITFALYADDKARARRGNWRISEQTLHLCELAGGWLGAFIAQRRLRHKSRKETYQTVFWSIVIIHHVVWLGWLFLGKTF